jgi:hypothetical protein
MPAIGVKRRGPRPRGRGSPMSTIGSAISPQPFACTDPPCAATVQARPIKYLLRAGAVGIGLRSACPPPAAPVSDLCQSTRSARQESHDQRDTYQPVHEPASTLNSLAQMTVPAELAWSRHVDNNSRRYARGLRAPASCPLSPCGVLEGTQGHTHARNRGIAEARRDHCLHGRRRDGRQRLAAKCTTASSA